MRVIVTDASIDDRTKSSTFKEVTPGGFFISYLDNTAAEGDYISESFAFQGSSSTVTGLQMGLVTATNETSNQVGGITGLMGIGYDTLESTNTPYPNLPDQLVSQGIINAKAYSLYLDDVASSTSSILFGGIDTEKFVGSIESVPVQKVNGGYTRLNALISSLSFNSSGVVTPLIAGTADSVTLDSGFSYSYIEDAAVEAIYTELGAIDDTGGASGFAWVDCNDRCTKYDDFFSFQFGDASGPLINVPLAESIIGPVSKPANLDLPFDNACIVAFLPGSLLSPPYHTLGDTFLRSAYVVYDLQNNEIALAQSNFEASGSNIVDIEKGATGIPNLGGVESGVTKLPLTSTCPPQSSSTSSAGPSSTSSSATQTSSSGIQSSPSSTPGGGSTLSSIASTPTGWSNSSMPATQSSTTSTITTTSVYTITSCPPTVTNCPIGKKTTETIEITTTFCPGSQPTLSPESSFTSTVYTTLTYSSGGHLTTETRSLYTTVCPVTVGSSTSTQGGVVKTSASGGIKASPTPTGPLTFTGGASRSSGAGIAAVVLMALGLIVA